MIPYKSHSFTHISSDYTLQVMMDDGFENPFTACDCEPPNMYVYDRDSTHHGTESIVSELLDLITDRRLVLNKKIILDAFDTKTEEEIREDIVHTYSHGNDFADALRDELIGNDDNIELVETLARVAKIPHLRFDSRGYSQGDYADALILLTPSWYKKTGANPKHSKKILESTKNLFNSWIWGDVYGFELVEHIPLTRPDGTMSTKTEDEIIESCWGFYGDEGIESMKHSLPDFAKHAIDNLEYTN